MAACSPHHADVFSHLPAQLMRELDSPAVADVLAELLATGWSPGQLRHRVGAEPAQGSAQDDAAHLLALLRGLLRQRLDGCSLCQGEGVFAVTDEVHLCRRCVGLIASGGARLEQTG